MKPAIFLLVFLLALPAALAWDADTHRQACVDAADLLGWDYNETLLKEACVAPDKHFYNTRMHHCYWWDCPALYEAYKWRERGDLYSMGVAAHYRADSECPMHHLVFESWECHREYEHEIGELVKLDRFNFTYELDCDQPAQKFTFTSGDYQQLVEKIAEFWNRNDEDAPVQFPVPIFSQVILNLQRRIPFRIF